MKKHNLGRTTGVAALMCACAIIILGCGNTDTTSIEESGTETKLVFLEDLADREFSGNNEHAEISLQVNQPQNGVSDGYMTIAGEGFPIVLIEGGGTRIIGFNDQDDISGLFVFEIEDEDTLVFARLFVNGEPTDRLAYGGGARLLSK